MGRKSANSLPDDIKQCASWFRKRMIVMAVNSSSVVMTLLQNLHLNSLHMFCMPPFMRRKKVMAEGVVVIG